MRNELLVTRWDSTDLVVLREGVVADRIAASDIRRVILVCRDGDTPSDLDFALIDTGTEHVLLPAASGIAARVYFERQPWWTQQACIYWVTGRHAPLPSRLCSRVWLLRRHQPAYMRLPAAELQELVESWLLQGPQTWEQRKWANIGAARHPGALSRSPRACPEKN
jgi:hypothetical protein